jgi:predicted ATPase
VSDGELVPATVVAGLKLRLMSGDATAQILDYLSDKDPLLIVDNCEHLIDETADPAEQFAARPGASALLATNREKLNIDAEQVIVVPPLSTAAEHPPHPAPSRLRAAPSLAERA